MRKDVRQRRDADPWAEHPCAPLEDWKFEVQNDDTRLGYWEWVDALLDGDI